jgi:hypothetical protein
LTDAIGHAKKSSPAIALDTTRVVLDGAPVRLVTHDEDDGSWQFLCGTTNDVADARLVHVSHLLESGPHLVDFADLPLGWLARCDAHGVWRRAPVGDEEEAGQ